MKLMLKNLQKPIVYIFKVIFSLILLSVVFILLILTGLILFIGWALQKLKKTFPNGFHWVFYIPIGILHWSSFGVIFIKKKIVELMRLL